MKIIVIWDFFLPFPQNLEWKVNLRPIHSLLLLEGHFLISIILILRSLTYTELILVETFYLRFTKRSWKKLKNSTVFKISFLLFLFTEEKQSPEKRRKTQLLANLRLKIIFQFVRIFEKIYAYCIKGDHSIQKTSMSLRAQMLEPNHLFRVLRENIARY